MAIQEKYQTVIDLINQSGGRNLNVIEEGGVLKITAIVPTPNEKNAIWDRIKAIAGDNPADLMADITMDNPNVPAPPPPAAAKTYTVKSGDSLSKIAKEMYGDANKYMDIFNANKDKLSNPDKISPGQELVIP